MKVVVHGRNVDVTDYVKEYVTKKVKRLERYLPEISEVRAELTQNMTRSANDRFTAQVTIWANGQILRAEEATSDIFASVDMAIDKISNQIRRFKGRRHDNKRRAGQASPKEMELAAADVAEEWPMRRRRAISSAASSSRSSRWTKKRLWSRWNCWGTISSYSTIPRARA